MPPRLAHNQGAIHTTAEGVSVFVTPGNKKPREQFPHDFLVSYRRPVRGARARTPKHIHIIVDLYRKRDRQQRLTNRLVDHIINEIIGRVAPVSELPQALQVFRPEQIQQFARLNGIGDYSPEFLLVVVELLMIQERTNYSDGDSSLNLFQKFRDGGDIFSVVGAATYRDRWDQRN